MLQASTKILRTDIVPLLKLSKSLADTYNKFTTTVDGCSITVVPSDNTGAFITGWGEE